MNKLILSVIGIVFIVGLGGMVVWQSFQSNDLQREIQDLQKQNKTLVSQNKKLSQNLAETTKPSAQKNTVIKNTNSSLCTDEPMGTDIGRDIYPIDPKYKNTQFLGQIFTAYKCSEERMSKIYGVKGDTYTLGSSVLLKNNPSPSLIATFTSLGFECDQKTADATCTRWETKKILKIEDIMKLEPFSENFEVDDCINCG